MIDRSKLIGISALIGAGFLFGLSAVLAKYLTGVMNPFAAIEFRFLIAFIVVAVIILLRRKLVFKNLDSKLLVIYAFSFPASVIFITLAIYHGTATVTTVAAFGTILICSFLLGRIFLNEKITVKKGSAFILVLAAIFILTDPFGDFQFTLELLFAVLCGVCNASGLLTQRIFAAAGADRVSLLALQCLVGAIIALLFLIIQGASFTINFDFHLTLLTIVFGVTSLAIVYLTLLGLKYIALNTGSILTSSQLFFAPLLAALFLHETVGLNILIGGVLIFAATVIANIERSEVNQSDD